MGSLVLINVKTMNLTRYVGNKVTHEAHAEFFDPVTIEAFRVGPPDEFAVIESPERA